jgi:hypothetical protein
MTAVQPFVAPIRPSDGVRSGINGWWISEAEAKERTIGNEMVEDRGNRGQNGAAKTV